VQLDLAGFLARAAPYLLESELENQLLLSLAYSLANPEAPRSEQLLVASAGQPVGAALYVPPQPLQVTRLDARAAEAVACAFARAEPRISVTMGPDAASELVARALALHAGAAVEQTGRQILLGLTEVAHVPEPPGTIRPAEEADFELCTRWYREFEVEARPPYVGDPAQAVRWALEARTLYLWDHGGPVALARLGSPTPTGNRIGPVYTAPDRRGRGYATALVARLSRQALASGKRFVCLFVDENNPLARRVYTRIGYRTVTGFGIWRLQSPR